MDPIHEIFKGCKKSAPVSRNEIWAETDDDAELSAEEIYLEESKKYPVKDSLVLTTEGKDITFKVAYWAKYGKERIYFDSITAGAYGKACWDIKAHTFIACDKRVGKRMETAIKAAMNLL